MQMVFNVIIILFSTMIIWPALRRFQNGISLFFMKFILFLIPAAVYILAQLLYCLMQVHKANKMMIEIENHTRKKISDINVDDDAFKEYVNNIYELMLLTKYVGKLKENANVANVDVDNFRYHREELNNALTESLKISKLLRIDINKDGNNLKNIQIKLGVNKYENDAYCPLLYAKQNDDKYIVVNNEQSMKISSELLNIVDSIKFDSDEVYNEQY